MILKTKNFSLILIIGMVMLSGLVQGQSKSIYDIKLSSLDGDKIDLNQFKGKKILFVNTASKCGFTPQYEDLEKLHQAHGDKVVIIGIPCNQFGKQEPGNSEEIAEFCQKNYGVSFLMAEKSNVKGNEQHELYAWLTKKDLNGVMNATVNWNFNKFLVDEKGHLVKHYQSGVKPMGEKLLTDIQQ